MRLPSAHSVKIALQFVLKNFATPIVFYVTFEELGAKPAIAFAMIVTCIQLLVHRLCQIRISPFFIVASGFTVGFGMIDLFLDHPRFFRLEPFVQNFVIAAVFAVTLFTRTPIIAWFTDSLPERIRPRFPNSESTRETYLRHVTAAWTFYLFLKSFLFLYLAFQVSLGELIVLRAIIGNITLAMMFVGELLYRKRFLLRRGFHRESER